MRRRYDNMEQLTFKSNIKRIITAILAILLLAVIALSRLTMTDYTVQSLEQEAVMQWHTDTYWGGWMTITYK